MKDLGPKPDTAGLAEAKEVSLPRWSGVNRLTELIIGAAIEVHRNTGPGLMESVYEECLCYGLGQLGLAFQRQVELPISYKQIKLNSGFRMDLVVEDTVVLELKTVDQLLPIHRAQLLTYLKLSGKTLGLLINFNEPVLRKGLKRLTTAPIGDPTVPSVTSVSSVASTLSFDFPSLNSLCLCASVVNK
jgi:GxxExxY protein